MREIGGERGANLGENGCLLCHPGSNCRLSDVLWRLDLCLSVWDVSFPVCSLGLYAVKLSLFTRVKSEVKNN